MADKSTSRAVVDQLIMMSRDAIKNGSIVKIRKALENLDEADVYALVATEWEKRATEDPKTASFLAASALLALAKGESL